MENMTKRAFYKELRNNGVEVSNRVRTCKTLVAVPKKDGTYFVMGISSEKVDIQSIKNSVCHKGGNLNGYYCKQTEKQYDFKNILVAR